MTNQRQAAIYATERAKVLFGGYRRGDANDPDQYVASIAAVLAMYEPELISRVTDPRTGIATTEKFLIFMPNAGELKAHCDAEAAMAARIRRYAALPPPQRRQAEPRRHRANCFVHAAAPQYPAMLERTQGADPHDFRFEERPGVWVPITWLHDMGERGELRRPDKEMLERIAAREPG